MPEAGWVRIYNPEQLEDPDVLPDPDDPDYKDSTDFATVTEESYELAWKRRGWKNLDEDRAGASPENMPERANDRIAWVDAADSEHDRKMRATAVLRDENSRGVDGRSTVIDHAEAVLSDTSTEDQTNSTNNDEQES
jgi:hypothetical protein